VGFEYVSSFPLSDLVVALSAYREFYMDLAANGW